MDAYMQRVVEEKEQLDERIGKLAAFLCSNNGGSIGDKEYSLLGCQLKIMTEYSRFLRERINLYNERMRNTERSK